MLKCSKKTCFKKLHLTFSVGLGHAAAYAKMCVRVPCCDVTGQADVECLCRGHRERLFWSILILCISVLLEVTSSYHKCQAHIVTRCLCDVVGSVTEHLAPRPHCGSPSPRPLGNHRSVLRICEFVFVRSRLFLFCFCFFF